MITENKSLLHPKEDTLPKTQFSHFSHLNQDHIAIWGSDGTGKSTFMAKLCSEALADGVKTTIVNFAQAESRSPEFPTFVEFFKGIHVNITDDCLNPFQLPNIPSSTSVVEKENLLEEWREYLLRLLQAMVAEDTGITFTTPIEHSLRTVLESFFANTEIKQRYEQASQSGFGSSAWSQYPVLADYLKFCDMDIPEEEFIYNQLLRWIGGKYSKVFNSVSTIEIDHASLLSIQALDCFYHHDNLEVETFSNLSYLIAIRRGIAVSESLQGSFLCLDKPPGNICPIVRFANQIKMLVLMTSISPRSILDSADGSSIISAIKHHFIGYFFHFSISNVAKFLNVSPNMLRATSSQAFCINTKDNISNWLSVSSGTATFIGISLPPILIDILQPQFFRVKNGKLSKGERLWC